MICKKLNVLNKNYKEVKEECEKIKNENMELKQNLSKLTEEFLDQQCRSMRDNLVFEEIPETQGEDCEALIRGFLHGKMNMDEDVTCIVIDRANRMGTQKRKQDQTNGSQDGLL